MTSTEVGSPTTRVPATAPSGRGSPRRRNCRACATPARSGLAAPSPSRDSAVCPLFRAAPDESGSRPSRDVVILSSCLSGLRENRMGPWRSPVAHLHGMQGVRGSNPLGSTRSTSQTAIPKPEQGIWDGRSTFIRHFLRCTHVLRMPSRCFRAGSESLAHLVGMTCETPLSSDLESVLSISDLAARLGVPIQTIYDLRHKGRGPHGFRIGRELEFRASDVEAWLRRLEDDDERRSRVGRG
jgi:excisionase family DNA binding protein